MVPTYINCRESLVARLERLLSTSQRRCTGGVIVIMLPIHCSRDDHARPRERCYPSSACMEIHPEVVPCPRLPDDVECDHHSSQKVITKNANHSAALHVFRHQNSLSNMLAR